MYSCMQKCIKEQQLRGTVEVKAGSIRPRELSDVHMLARKAKQNPHVTAKDLQEGLADTGVVVHCSTVQHCLHMI